MDEKILVSVITPIYKGQKYIPNLLRMIEENSLNFKKGKIEFVLINDFPQVPLCVDQVNNKNIEIQIIENDKNLGIQESRIIGVRAAKGNFILMLDQDDEITPNAIESQFLMLKSNDAVISNGYYEDSNLNQKSLYNSKNQLEKVNDLAYYCYIGNMIASPGICLIRKSCIPDIWLKNLIEINGADDWLLWAAYLINGYSFSINEEFTYIHKKVEHNTSDDEEKMLSSSQQALDVLNNQLKFSDYQKDLLKVYSRRLEMRRKMVKKGKVIKALNYFMNLDIMLYLLKYKFGK